MSGTARRLTDQESYDLTGSQAGFLLLLGQMDDLVLGLLTPFWTAQLYFYT